MMTAGLILSIMVIPFITAVMRDVFELVPPMLKESAYGLGASTWEVVWKVVLPYTKIGVVGGIMLGLGRALGETMAVTFVIGNAHRLSTSLMAPGNSIASALANEFTEAVGDLYFSALIELGLILFLITTIVLALSKFLLMRLARQEGDADVTETAMSVISPTNRVYLCPQAQERGDAHGILACARFRAVLAGVDHRSRCCTRAALRSRGISLYTQMTPPPGADGGLANAIAGSLVMVSVGTLLGTPVGILAGTYLAEYGRGSWLASATRFLNDVLLSAPSIVIGLVRLFGLRGAGGAFFRMGRLDRARAARDSGGGAHDRRYAQARAGQPARGGGCARLPDVENDHVQSPTARRAPASSPVFCLPWRASAARPRRCCSLRSTTSSGRST